MKNKKKRISNLLLILSVLINIGFVISISLNIIYTQKVPNKNQTIAMYIENDSGKYEPSSSSIFPTEGYILNTEKSNCTNGGKISQDQNTKKLSVSTSNKTECTVYFDIEKIDYAKKTLDALNIIPKTGTNNFAKPAPEIALYADGELSSSSNISTTSYSSNYYTYADSYEFDNSTGLYTLVNPSVCKYSSCYTTLKGKYVVALYGNSASTIIASTDLETIYKIGTSTTSSKLYYQKSTKSIVEYDYSKDGVYSMEDDYGTSYYFRGAATNNYVKFAGFYWRILRINGNGSLRIIYDGTSAHSNEEANIDKLSHINQIFNSGSDNKYLGWMYGPEGTTSSTSAAQAQTNTIDSNIKQIVDLWYKENIVDKGYNENVADILFCNDRSIPGKNITGNSQDTGLGYGNNITYFGSSVRIGAIATDEKALNPNPSFKCPQKNDAFTVNDTEKGNGNLTYPIGLITIDEAIAAGSGKLDNGLSAIGNTKYYLHKGTQYWTISPTSKDNVNVVFDNGSIYASGMIIAQKGIAPVINLSQEYVQTLIGTGTMTDPYRAPDVTP